MPRRIRHDFLHTAQDDQPLLRIADAKRVRHLELDMRPRQIGHQRAQRAREIETIARVLLGDDGANLGQQRPRQRLRFFDVVMCRSLGAHESRLKVERQRREVMPERIMQLAGDAKPFRQAAAVGYEIVHGP